MSRSRQRSRTGTRAAVAGPMTTEPTTTEAKMSDDTTQHTPADVREQTDVQINVWSIIRSALSRAWALSRPWAVADRPQVTSEVVARLDAIAADCEREVLALLRSPRGEGEAWRAFLDAMDEFEAAANLWVDPEGPSAEDMARLDRARQRVIECARALAALRPDAQGEDRWEDLVFGPITEAYNEAHAAGAKE